MTDDLTPIVSVVVPMKDAASTVDETLAALSSQHFDGVFEIVVADNGSTDRSPEIVHSYAVATPFLRYVDASARPGPAHARNSGAVAATAPLLAFCDADDVPALDWLEALVEAHGGQAAVGGKLEYQQLNDARQIGTRSLLQTTGLPRPMGYLPFSSTANLLVPKANFLKIGGFDERLLTGEDVDFCWRLQQSGCDLRFAHRAIVHYRLRGSLLDGLRQLFRYATGDPLIYRLHAKTGARRKSAWGVIYSWARLLGTSPSVLFPVPRRRWLRMAAKHAGWVVGSIRHRVVYL